MVHTVEDPIETPTSDFRDRSFGLLVFGVLEILIGLFCALLVPLSLVAVSLTPAAEEGGLNPGSVLPAMVLYLVVAVVFIWIGIGSVRARRWARDLMLSLSWIWLLTGICTLLISWLVMPGLLLDMGAAVGLSSGDIAVVALVTLSILSFVYVFLPGAFVLFYRSESVAATCRSRDPRPQWTDGCPSRLLTLTLLWALTAVSVLVMPAYRFVTPFFGFLVDGAAGAVVWVVVLVVCAVLAWGTCRRAPWAWRLGVAATLLAAVSTILTFARVEAVELYRAMGLPAEQLALLAGLASPERWLMTLLWAVVWLSFLGYLVTLKRLFHPPQRRSRD